MTMYCIKSDGSEQRDWKENRIISENTLVFFDFLRVLIDQMS